MKLPEPPPAFDPIGFSFELLDRIGAEQDGRYLHWDELRHRSPPEGMTHAQWWTGIWLARRAQSRELPLHDKNDEPFTFVMTDTLQRLVHQVDRDASGRLELPDEITNVHTRDRYIVSSLIEEAITSSQLEGASTTRAVAKEMLRTLRAPRTVDETMILNNYRAMEWVRAHEQDPLTPAMLLELQEIVTRDTLDVADGGGRFRRDDDDVTVIDVTDGEVLHVPPPAAQLAARIDALCTFANGTTSKETFIHPVVRAIVLHLWVAYDHPFVDGNGRTARALFYWAMLNQKYWLTEYISISSIIKKARGQYDRTFLYTESEGNDATYFLLHQLAVLRAAIDTLFAHLRNKVEELRTLDKQLRSRDDLNNRQLAVLGHALRHPDDRLTIDGHRNSHRVVYETARTDLLDLVRKGYLQEARVGRRMYFQPARDLERRLSGRAARPRGKSAKPAG